MKDSRRRSIASVLCAVLLLFGAVSTGHAEVHERDAAFRLESFAIGLNPAFIADTQSRRIADMLHARLVRGEQGGNFIGEIAEGWEWLTPSTLRFRIRSGLTFSNGQVVTSADAAWSICRLLQPDAPTRWLFSNVKHVLIVDGERARCDGLRTDGPDILDIEVSAEADRLLPALASTSAAIVPETSEPGEYGVVPGAGPYVVERIEPNARVVLRGRRGGALVPGFENVVFRLVQDDATAVALFRAAELDLLEIGNPTLFRLTVDGEEPRVSGQLLSSEVDQVRLLIFNEPALSDRLGLSESETKAWVRSFTAQIDVESIAHRFSPLLIPMHTSYFPAWENLPDPSSRRAGTTRQPELRQVDLTIITENDPFSDGIAAAVTQQVEQVGIDYLGLEKSVLISRLINRQYEIASILLEAQVHHPAYWLSFFKPSSPFTVFGTPLEGLMDPGEPDATEHNRTLIDEHGNWFILARERRFVLVQPWIDKLSFHQTGLLNYATIETAN